jgi:hypothetical protein
MRPLGFSHTSLPMVKLPSLPLGKSQMALLYPIAPPNLVDRRIKLSNPTPSLSPHYQTSSFLWVSPCLCPYCGTPAGTLTLMVVATWASPGCTHCLRTSVLVGYGLQDDGFPCSAQTPVSGSRRLYAGYRPDSNQVSSGLFPGQISPPVLISVN